VHRLLVNKINRWYEVKSAVLTSSPVEIRNANYFLVFVCALFRPEKCLCCDKVGHVISAVFFSVYVFILSDFLKLYMVFELCTSSHCEVFDSSSVDNRNAHSFNAKPTNS